MGAHNQFLAVLATTILLIASPARAAPDRAYSVTATAACTATQASYDDKIKKRPLGILNEGPGFVLIACSLPIDFNADYAVTPAPGNGQQFNSIEIWFTSFFSNYPFAKTVTCNVITGDRSSWKTRTISISLQEGQGPRAAYTEYLDRRTVRGSYNLLCQVPAGVEMGTITYRMTDLDGRL